jgi:hypothetical protein
VVITPGLETLVRPVSIKGSIQVGRYLTFHHKVFGIAFHLDRAKGELQEGVIGWHRLRHSYFLLSYC